MRSAHWTTVVGGYARGTKRIHPCALDDVFSFRKRRKPARPETSLHLHLRMLHIRLQNMEKTRDGHQVDVVKRSIGWYLEVNIIDTQSSREDAYCKFLPKSYCRHGSDRQRSYLCLLNRHAETRLIIHISQITVPDLIKNITGDSSPHGSSTTHMSPANCHENGQSIAVFSYLISLGLSKM